MSHLLRIGDYVDVAPSNRSSGGTGWVKSVDATGTASIQYVLTKKISKEVVPQRIVLATIDNTARSQDEM